MGYHFEIWLRDFAKDYLRGISNKDSDSYHPHVTIIRPFDIVSSEEDVKKRVADFCKWIVPMPFYLEGIGDFDGKFYHVPVIEDGELMQFNNGLENLLNGDVNFVKKIEPIKKFHATVNDNMGEFDCPRIDQYMIRLTCLFDKKIRFSYDFVTEEILNREDSLDEGKWNENLRMFSNQSK